MSKAPFSSKPGKALAGAMLALASVGVYAAAVASPSGAASYGIFLCLVPLFFFAERNGPFISALAGAAVGAAVLGISCSWLSSYHPAAVLIGMGVGAWWFAIALGLISAALRTGSAAAPIAVAFIWAAAEIGRAIGFLAFPYASLPYALVESSAAMRLASVGGAPLVGLLVAAANVSFYSAVRKLRLRDTSSYRGAAIRASFGAACMAATLAFGAVHVNDAFPSSSAPIRAALGTEPPAGYYRVALVQPCVISQKTVPEYAAALRSLVELTTGAAALSPDLVAWHETAIVPPVEWHMRHRPDRDTYEYVARAARFLGEFQIPLLFGNGYASPEDTGRAVEHNSAMLSRAGSFLGRYDKVKLVPFSEYLPPYLRFPALSRWVVSMFGEYWTPGAGPTTFSLGAASFAAPICFEDSFGRYFASFDEPDFFVVLTNDAWARSAAMQRQHLAMSRYRAAETGSIVLRAADTGSTAAVAPNGAVAFELPAFQRGVLCVDVPLGAARRTPYEAFGKHIDIVIFCMALALSALCAFHRLSMLRIDKNNAV